MQRSDIFVLPTLADNLPCVVLESHCCGTPVISMQVNGVPELIDEHNGIMVPPGDADALANALIECITQPHRFDRNDISKKALQRYSRKVIADRIDEVYRTVASLHRNSR
ncbi:MAG: glycosyltransferase, partial [Bacteroidota bacterium]|nr:glycosyltransferase [Bacteroidota bacterium]